MWKNWRRRFYAKSTTYLHNLMILLSNKYRNWYKLKISFCFVVANSALTNAMDTNFRYTISKLVLGQRKCKIYCSVQKKLQYIWMCANHFCIKLISLKWLICTLRYFIYCYMVMTVVCDDGTPNTDCLQKLPMKIMWIFIWIIIYRKIACLLWKQILVWYESSER